MHIELLDLRLIVAIADTGSLSKAAATLPIATPAAGNRLRQVEERIGMGLFARNPGGMELAPAGRLVLERARHVLAEMERLHATISDLAGQRRVTLKLAGTTIANCTFLPAALGPFLADYPEVDVQLAARASVDILAALLAGDIEVGVLDGSVATGDVVSLPFRRDRLVLLAPPGHPLSERPTVRFRDALEYAFVCLPPDRALQRFVERMAVRTGRPLRIQARAPSFFAIAQLVAQQAGVALVPEAAVRGDVRDLATVMIALEDPWASRELRICVRSWDTLSTHAHELVSYLAMQEASCSSDTSRLRRRTAVRPGPARAGAP